ncbi:hypothetical protein NDU88_004305 [Pleurodeles waltl]|uniref:Uncharacterized protein n=1 Tax=Pleurodeles waltl TaxID=8319 RepID=A0AAV7PFM2_PLEWA|nr:hypothetical protein NDU88_004305 [Pleurodeles waltl]
MGGQACFESRPQGIMPPKRGPATASGWHGAVGLRDPPTPNKQEIVAASKGKKAVKKRQLMELKEFERPPRGARPGSYLGMPHCRAYMVKACVWLKQLTDGWIAAAACDQDGGQQVKVRCRPLGAGDAAAAHVRPRTQPQRFSVERSGAPLQCGEERRAVLPTSGRSQVRPETNWDLQFSAAPPPGTGGGGERISPAFGPDTGEITARGGLSPGVQAVSRRRSTQHTEAWGAAKPMRTRRPPRDGRGIVPR